MKRAFAAFGLAFALALGLVASSPAKKEKQKPVAVGAEISIGSTLQSAENPLYLYRFSGKVTSKAACRADRQVVVSLSTDGGAPVPDRRKGGFTDGQGNWVSVYEVVLESGHTYSAFASVNRTTVKRQKQAYRCKAASSPSVTVTP